jgi:acetyl esterase/lipase
MSSSRLCTLTTPFVNLHYLYLIGKEYQESKNAEHAEADPWLSPIIMPDELIKSFPRTYISVGGLDPLLDDSIYLGRRLYQNDVPVKIEVYDGLDHGFLHASHSIETVREAVDKIGEMILSFR